MIEKGKEILNGSVVYERININDGILNIVTYTYIH